MPTVNLKTSKPNSNLSKPSSGTLLSVVEANSASEKSESACISIETTTKKGTTSRAMETRESDLKVVTEKKIYGKSTKSFEIRRRINLEKAREMDVKMENYKKYSDSPAVTPNTKNPKTPANTIEQKQQRGKRSTTRARSPAITKRKENISEKSPQTKSSTRRTGGGISNLSFRLKEPATPHVVVEPRTARHKHAECQASTSDINNCQTLTDVKVIEPSPDLWAAILKKRNDDLRRQMMKEERFVPEYLKSEVNYQTNLKEFLETGTVRHYDREFENQNEDKSKLKSTKSDDLKRALRYKPRIQPEMDLKKRIPKIEEELMRIFKGRT